MIDNEEVDDEEDGRGEGEEDKRLTSERAEKNILHYR